MIARRLFQALVFLYSATSWGAVLTPPKIPEQPIIRSIHKWGDQIAVVTEERGRSGTRFAYLLSVVDPSVSRLVPFRGLDCASYFDVAHDATLGKLLLCGNGGSARVYAFDGQSWNPLSDSVQGTESRFTVEGDRIAVVSENTVHLFSRASKKSVVSIPIKIAGPRSAPTAMLLAGEALLLAYDHGEWGGGLYRIDLKHPDKTPTRLIGENVRALARAKSGVVWAAGGLSHLRMASGSLHRIADGDARVAARVSGFEGPKGPDIKERSGARFPGLTEVAGLALGKDDRPIVVLPQFGVFEFARESFVALYKGPLHFNYTMPGYGVGSSPQGLAISDSGEIHVASRSLGVFVLRKNRDRYDLEQLIFDQPAYNERLKPAR